MREFRFPRAWCEGIASQIGGEPNCSSCGVYARSRRNEKLLREQPNYAEGLCALAVIDAALGKRDQAIQEARRASEMLSRNEGCAQRCAGGRLPRDHMRVTEIERVRSNNSRTLSKDLAALITVSLRLHPYFDGLRGNPDF